MTHEELARQKLETKEAYKQLHCDHPTHASLHETFEQKMARALANHVGRVEAVRTAALKRRVARGLPIDD